LIFQKRARKELLTRMIEVYPNRQKPHLNGYTGRQDGSLERWCRRNGAETHTKQRVGRVTGKAWGIHRIDNDAKRTHAWTVTLQRPPWTGLDGASGSKVIAEPVAAAGRDSEVVEKDGGPCRDRTCGPLIKSELTGMAQVFDDMGHPMASAA
jgi:hypothetical protein